MMDGERSEVQTTQVTSEEGFPVEFTFRPGLSEEERGTFEQALVLEGLWSQGLLFGGEIAREGGSGFVTREADDDGASCPSEQERLAVERWLSVRAEPSSAVVGPLSRRIFTTTIRIEPIAD